MQVSVENTSDLGRKISIVIPFEDVDPKVDARIKELAKQVKLDGFRPGKVPVNVVRQRFGEDARQEVIGKVLQSTLFEAIESEKLNPAGMPEITSIKSKAGEPLEYEAEFEVYPSIELKDFSGLSVEKYQAEVSDEDVKDTLESMRKQRSEWNEVSRDVQKGDKVVIDFEGFKGDEAFEGGKGEGAELEIGSNAFIPGFEEGLIGHKAGEEVELNLTFPEDYHAKELAGEPVLFKVKIHKVSEAKLPELDSAFAESMGVKSGDIEELKTKIKEHMVNELEQARIAKQKQKLFEQLLEMHEFAVPKALVSNEIKAMFKRYMPDHEPTDEQINSIFPQVGEDAKKRVAIGLLVAEIIRKHEITVDQDKVKEQLESMAKSYEQPEQFVAHYYSDKNKLASIEAIVLEQQVFDKVCEIASVIDKNMSYKDVMQAN